MKILVVSDLHAYSKPPANGEKPSYAKAGDSSEESPLIRFEQLIQNGQIPRPDIIVCPGDLGHQADPPGIDFAWEFLKRLAHLSSRKLIISTAGNHDIDSRYQSDEADAKGALLDLRPSYPVVTDLTTHTADDDQKQLMFWARNYCLLWVDNTRFLILNSSAFHGIGKFVTAEGKATSSPEYEHGRISARTLNRLRSALTEDDANRAAANLPPAEINVLVCHHHLEPDGAVDDADKSQMRGAHALMQLLASSDHGRWLVIHGHRHRARLFQPGGATGPWVLSAASFSATRDKDYDNRSPNQAHLVEINFAGMTQLNFRPAGKISSWTWTRPAGWLADRYEGGGLPPATGFGFRGSIDDLASQISTFVGSLTSRWDAVVTAIPSLRFVAHDQFTELRKVLSKSYKINVLVTEDGLPFECGKSL